jgi:peptidyl-tRNA hydrolase, PTH1 family
MDSKKLLIVGLGNPGDRYKTTRHNIGFRVIDEFSKNKNTSFDNDKTCSVAKIQETPHVLFLLKPLEFMNLSGSCTVKLVSKFKIPIDDIIVVHDEIDFPFGKLKLKVGGGHAGHNGLRSIIDLLASNDFHRLRFGVGRPENPNFQVSDYVLSNFGDSENEKLPELITSSINKLNEWILQKTKG